MTLNAHAPPPQRKRDIKYTSDCAGDRECQNAQPRKCFRNHQYYLVVVSTKQSEKPVRDAQHETEFKRRCRIN